jgi:hypothetical protein
VLRLRLYFLPRYLGLIFLVGDVDRERFSVEDVLRCIDGCGGATSDGDGYSRRKSPIVGVRFIRWLRPDARDVVQLVDQTSYTCVLRTDPTIVSETCTSRSQKATHLPRTLGGCSCSSPVLIVVLVYSRPGYLSAPGARPVFGTFSRHTTGDCQTPALVRLRVSWAVWVILSVESNAGETSQRAPTYAT